MGSASYLLYCFDFILYFLLTVFDVAFKSWRVVPQRFRINYCLSCNVLDIVASSIPLSKEVTKTLTTSQSLSPPIIFLCFWVLFVGFSLGSQGVNLPTSLLTASIIGRRSVRNACQPYQQCGERGPGYNPEPGFMYFPSIFHQVLRYFLPPQNRTLQIPIGSDMDYSEFFRDFRVARINKSFKF